MICKDCGAGSGVWERCSNCKLLRKTACCSCLTTHNIEECSCGCGAHFCTKPWTGADKKPMNRPCMEVHLGTHETPNPLREVDIEPLKNTVNAAAVELLEEMLELAESGHVVEVMLIGFRDDGCTMSSFTETLDHIRRLGALEFLKYRFQSENQEVP